jgi:uncharacterized protein (UPF0332 family)
MSFDWSEFLLVAKLLNQQGENGIHAEASYRSAVSRSYYSAFCHARNFARDHLSFIPGNDFRDHHRIRDHFSRYYRNQPRFNKIHVQLQKLHQLRKECDYVNEIAHPSILARDAIRLSESIIKNLQKGTWP